MCIKACIAKQVKQYDFPNKQLANDSYTHNLAKLLATAGLKQACNNQESQDNNFKLNWAVASKWSEESRYECVITQQDASDLFIAITDNQSGLLPWLKTFL